MKCLLPLLLCVFSLCGADYDCIFVGSSPISLFEALYQHASGKSVLILDDAPTCGGVWRSIEVCGVKDVDVGCHEIGNSAPLKEFLEVYGGCTMLSLQENRSFYFAGGCRELIRNLEKRIANSSIELLLNHRVDRATLDANYQYMIVESNGEKYTTNKIYTSSYSFFLMGDEPNRTVNKSKYYHLYLLINDSSPARFSYQSNGVSGTSRMMNLTHFNDLSSLGQQLIVFQTHNADNLQNAEKYLTELKSKNLIASNAYILRSESYIYEQWPANNVRVPTNCSQWIDQMNTFDFRGIIKHIDRWKKALAPYSEAVR